MGKLCSEGRGRGGCLEEEKRFLYFSFTPQKAYSQAPKLKTDHISTLICMTESYATSSFYNNSTYNSVSSAIKHLFLRNKRWGWHFEKLFEPSLTEGIVISHVMLYLFYLNKLVSWKGTVIQKPSTLLQTNMKSQSMKKVKYQ